MAQAFESTTSEIIINEEVTDRFAKVSQLSRTFWETIRIRYKLYTLIYKYCLRAEPQICFQKLQQYSGRVVTQLRVTAYSLVTISEALTELSPEWGAAAGSVLNRDVALERRCRHADMVYWKITLDPDNFHKYYKQLQGIRIRLGVEMHEFRKTMKEVSISQNQFWNYYKQVMERDQMEQAMNRLGLSEAKTTSTDDQYAKRGKLNEDGNNNLRCKVDQDQGLQTNDEQIQARDKAQKLALYQRKKKNMTRSYSQSHVILGRAPSKFRFF